MKKLFILSLAGIICASLTGISHAQTKRELQFMIKEVITDDEYEMMLKLREATGRSWVDIFDNSIEPLRKDDLHSNESSRKYILPAEGENIRPVVIRPIEEKPKSSLEVNAAPVVRESDIEPVKVRQTENEEKKRKIYPREYKYRERFKAEKEVDAREAEKAPQTEEVQKSEAKSLREKLRDARALEKRRKVIDRKPRIYRSAERRRQIEEYNRTKGQTKFGGARVDDEFEDRGFSTRAFKKKPFGSKIIYDEEKIETEFEDEGFSTKGFKKKDFGSKIIYDEDKSSAGDE